jgi:5'-3' exonuclease
MIALVDVSCYLNAAAYEAEDLEGAINRVEFYIQTLTDEVFATDWVGAVDGPDNHRQTVFFDYKQSVTRKSARDRRKDWFPDLKNYIASLSNVVMTDNEEADDLLAQWSTQLKELGVDHCIITTDKDLMTVPTKIFSPAVKKYFKLDSNFKEFKNKESFRFFCKQMLMGDSVDFIPGLPGLGPVKAELILSETDSPILWSELVKNKYKEVYEENWRDYFLSNGKMLYIVRRSNEWFTEELFDRLTLEADAEEL